MRQFFAALVVLVCTACASSKNDPFLGLAKDCDSSPSASSCAAAGDYLWKNNGKALRPCKDPTWISCQRPEEDRAAAVRRIDKTAFEYHDRACFFGDADACNKAGVAYAVEYANASDNDAPQFARHAEQRFERACKLGSKEGCRNVGTTRPAK
jgi:hypothetical protein